MKAARRAHHVKLISERVSKKEATNEGITPEKQPETNLNYC